MMELTALNSTVDVSDLELPSGLRAVRQALIGSNFGVLWASSIRISGRRKKENVRRIF